MADLWIASETPKLLSNARQYVQDMSDMSGFAKALERSKTWHTSEEYNNRKRRSYALQHNLSLHHSQTRQVRT
jgi:hypothetical protein